MRLLRTVALRGGLLLQRRRIRLIITKPDDSAVLNTVILIVLDHFRNAESTP